MSVLIAGAGRLRRRINLVVDGNSISANHYTTIGTFDNHIAAVPALSPRVVSHSCFAVSGHKWSDMLGHVAGVSSAWVEGAVNILIAWETTNSCFNVTTTAEQVIADAKAYVAACLSAHPWTVVGVTALPRGGSAAYSVKNQMVVDVNGDMVANPGSYGFSTVVDVRAGHPEFDHDGNSSAAFASNSSLWVEGGVPYIHLTDAGKNLISPTIASAVLAVH